MKDFFKLMIMIFFLTISLSDSAQQFKRKGPNIGIQAGLNYDMMFPESGSGISYGAGITTRVFNIIYPSVNYILHNDNVSFNDSASNKLNGSLKYSTLYIPVSLRVPVITMSLGKTSGNRCTSLIIYAIAGLGYSHILSSDSNFDYSIKDPFSFHAGLGFNIHRQGQSLLNQFADIEYDIVYSRNISKNFSVGYNSVFGGSTIGIVMRILMFKTYKFGNM